jgi:hypothetical protein
MIPASIPVMGRTIKIEFKTMEAWGDADIETDTIHLSSALKAKDPEFAWKCLLHEIVHITLRISGIDNILEEKVEEAICGSLENLGPIIGLRL